MTRRWPTAYARNLANREMLRARGLCIECRKLNHTPEHWRCRRCRIKESLKQIARQRIKRSSNRKPAA
jgi:hypothetical protein